MALSGPALASRVFTDHLALFPNSIEAIRSNPSTGVPRHVPVEAFITGLCGGVVSALANVTIFDVSTGDDDIAGQSNPVQFQLSAIPVAEATFLTLSQWTGDAAADVVSVFVGSTLRHVMDLGRLKMSQNNDIGTGSGLVTPAQNPRLQQIMEEELSIQFPISFQATGKFGEGDIPANPVNQILLEQLVNYCKVFAIGIASITTTIQYTGGGAGSPADAATNSGSII